MILGHHPVGFLLLLLVFHLCPTFGENETLLWLLYAFVEYNSREKEFMAHIPEHPVNYLFIGISLKMDEGL